VRLSVSVPLVNRDRVGTGLKGLQGASHLVHVCLDCCYVCQSVVEGSVQPCLVDFFWECCGGVCNYDGRL